MDLPKQIIIGGCCVTAPLLPQDAEDGRGPCGLRPQDRQVGGDHYTRMDVQPWQAMRAWMSPDEFRGFLRGNAIKYLARAGTKWPAREDLEKAAHYLDALIGECPGECPAEGQDG